MPDFAVICREHRNLTLHDINVNTVAEHKLNLTLAPTAETGRLKTVDPSPVRLRPVLFHFASFGLHIDNLTMINTRGR